MNPRYDSNQGSARLARRRAKPFVAVREWWWNHDRRQHIAEMADRDRRHPLDEGHVVEALARQLEEIRNLPEVAH